MAGKRKRVREREGDRERGRERERECMEVTTITTLATAFI
jgi:hypothetical protein